MKIKLFAFLCFCISLMSCASVPVPRQVLNSFPIDRAFDKVWQAVIETFAELDLPILNKAIGPGVISTDWINLNNNEKAKEYFDCGKLGLLDIEDYKQGRFEVLIKKVGDSSCELKVDAVFEQAYHSSLLDSKILDPFIKRCVSTGKLEAEIFRRVSEKTK